MDGPILSTISLAMGASWLSGIRLHALLLCLGLTEQFHLAQLPSSFEVLASTPVLAVVGVLFVLEFCADKIPYVDTVWHFVDGFLRIPAGAILASAAFAHYDPAVRVLAFAIGGGIAATSHGGKTATKVFTNLSPEPFSNIALSVGEEIGVVATVALMFLAPIATIAIVVAATFGSVWLIRKALALRARRAGKQTS